MNFKQLFPLQVRTANYDRNTIVSHVLTARFPARYLRFVRFIWYLVNASDLRSLKIGI